MKNTLYKQLSEGKFVQTIDKKSQLQEFLQKKGINKIKYHFVDIENDKEFNVELMIEGKMVSSGSGFSKKDAEQEAAEIALNKLSNKAKQK